VIPLHDAPKPPFSEADWDALKERKPSLDLEHINDIAELSSQYLKAEAVEFSEGDLLNSLHALWKLSGEGNAKMKKSDAKKVEKMAIAAFGFGTHEQVHTRKDNARNMATQERHKKSEPFQKAHANSEVEKPMIHWKTDPPAPVVQTSLEKAGKCEKAYSASETPGNLKKLIAAYKDVVSSCGEKDKHVNIRIEYNEKLIKSDPAHKDDYLLSIVQLQLFWYEPTRAIGTMTRMDNQDRANVDLAGYYSKKGNFDEAYAVLQKISQVELYGKARETLVFEIMNQARNKRKEKYKYSNTNITHTNDDKIALQEVEKLAKGNQLKAAFQEAAKIESDSAFSNALDFINSNIKSLDGKPSIWG